MRCRVIAGSQARPVTAQPWSVIEILRAHRGRRLPRSYVLAMLPGRPSGRALDAYLVRARQALAGTAWEIVAPRGRGVAIVRREAA